MSLLDVKIEIVYPGIWVRVSMFEPMTAILCLLASSTISSLSKISVLPADTDRHVVAGVHHRLNGRYPDHRHIKPHILRRFRYFYDGQSSFGELARSADGRVGTFHRLYSDACRSSNDDRLAKIEPRDLARNMKAVIDVRQFRFVRLSFESSPMGARWSCTKYVESISSMPSLASSFATPPISASVLRRGSFQSILNIRTSGSAPETRQTYTSALLNWSRSATTFTALALQNPGAVAGQATVEMLSAGNQVLGSITIPLPAVSRITRDLAELFPQGANAAVAVRITSAQPIQVLGLLGDDATGNVVPVLAQ